MKSIHFKIILLLVLLLGCNNNFKDAHKNSFDDMQNGIDRIDTHFLIDEALLNFNRGFADKNNDFKIIAYVNKFNNKNKKWERYEELEFYYVKNGRIKSLKEKIFKEEYPNSRVKNYKYFNDILIEKLDKWGRNGYRDSSKCTFQYIDQNKLVVEKSFIAENNKWKNSYQFNYDYDLIGRLSEILGLSWDNLNNEWRKYYKYKYNYKSNDTITVIKFEDKNKVWKKSIKIDSVFNSNGQLLKVFEYAFNDKDWTLMNYFEKTYDKKERMVSDSLYNYNTNVVGKSFYLYNFKNQLNKIKRTYYDFDDSADLKGTDKYEELYRYNNLGQILVYELKDDCRYEFLYDSKGFIEKIIRYYVRDKSQFVKDIEISQEYYR